MDSRMIAFVEKKIAFVERMGLAVVTLAPGYVKLSAPLKGNENHIGSMYAGALFTLAEVPGGALFISTFDVTKYYPVVKEMKIRFRRPALTDVTIELSLSKKEVRRIQADVDEKGKAEYELNGEIRARSKEVVALSYGLYQMRANGS